MRTDTIRTKLYYWLIRLANWVKPGEYYDFNEQVVAMTVFLNRLYVATKSSMYRKNKTNDGWKKVS